MDRQEFEKTTTQKTRLNDYTIPHVDLSIGHYGYEQTTADKDFVSSKGYPTYRLHFITGGHLFLHQNGKKTRLRRNQCFCILPDEDMGFQTDQESPASFYWVSFTGQNAYRYLQAMGFSDKKHFLQIPTHEQRSLANAFYSSIALPESKQNLVDFTFVENFMRIVSILSSSAGIVPLEKKIRPKKHYVEEALKIIHARYSSPDFSIREVAKELFLHENYLSKLFKAELKQSFSNYVSLYRIEQAMHLIEEGHSSVSAIAYAVGFSDPLYFTKVFRFFYHSTPSEEIRKQAAQKPQ